MAAWHLSTIPLAAAGPLARGGAAGPFALGLRGIEVARTAVSDIDLRGRCLLRKAEDVPTDPIDGGMEKALSYDPGPTRTPWLLLGRCLPRAKSDQRKGNFSDRIAAAQQALYRLRSARSRPTRSTTSIQGSDGPGTFDLIAALSARRFSATSRR